MSVSGRYRIGCSYYPEWWSKEQWEKDFRKMRELGFNTVRMGEFAWHWFEPEDGVFSFEPMRQAIETAARFGVQTILCTPTAILPAWLYRKHPETKGGNERGAYDYPGRKGNCLNSEAFVRHARRIVQAEAEALGGNPNIIGWQLDNEAGYPFVCYDPNCLTAFREWLREKYRSIGALNAAWCTEMWSNTYNDFEEIHFPLNSAEAGWYPGMTLDYRCFFSDSFNRFLRMQTEILRPHTGDAFIYANWPGANWSVNCFEASGYLDYAGWDNYIRLPGPEDYRHQLYACMDHDFCRNCAGGGDHTFLVAEQAAQPHANAQPEAIRAQTWLDVAHGAFGTIFFEWRVPVGGPEQAYVSVLDRDGGFGVSEEVFRRMKCEFDGLGDKLAGARTVADIAMIYDYQSSWAMGSWTVNDAYDHEFIRYHSGFKTLGRNIDILPADADFSKYRIVLLPNLRCVSEETARRLAAYAENGGILVLNRECGTRDEYNRLRELLSPGLFRTAAGVKVRQSISAAAMAGQLTFGMQDQGVNDTLGIRFGDGPVFRPMHVLEKIEPEGAETLACFTAGKLKDHPAVTLNRYGCGYAVYVGTDCEDIRFYQTLAHTLAARFGIRPLLSVQDGIAVSGRVKDGVEYIIAVNLTETPLEAELRETCTDELAKRKISGRVTLPGLEVLVLSHPYKEGEKP